MFSFSYKGVQSSATLDKEIGLEDLVQMIKDHPQKEIIKQLHALPYGSDAYKNEKTNLPYVMPHGTFSKKRTKKNLLGLSGALFFDIDAGSIPEDIDSLKQSILHDHRDKICLIGRSVGYSGLFLYIRLKNPEILTPETFDSIHEYVRTKILADIPTDPGAIGIARAHIIPYDPDLYYNSVASLEVDLASVPEVKKNLITPINNTLPTGYYGNETFLPISEVMKRVKTKTTVDLQGKNILVKDILCCNLFIPKHVKDGNKHRIYTSMVNGLMLNNPDLELIYVLSFINYVNERHTNNQPMPRREMIRTVTNEYNRIQAGGKIKGKIKRYHTSPELPTRERLRLVARTRGKELKRKSISLIGEAVDQLKNAGIKPTEKKVATLLGGKPSLATIKRHWRRVMPKSIPWNFQYSIRGKKRPERRPVPGFEDQYEISETGTIYSLNIYDPEYDILGTVTYRIDRGGYPAVRLYNDGKTCTRLLHRIMAETFIPNPLNLPEVDHIDGNKQNFSQTNLRWCTHAQNIQYAYENGLVKKSGKTVVDSCAGITYKTIKEASLATGIPYSTLKNYLNGTRPNITCLQYLN